MQIDPGAALDDTVDDTTSRASAALDLVVETADEMSVLAARRIQRVYDMHRAESDAAARHGHDLTDVVERGIRLELAAALRITESVAGSLLVFADAMVDRYPAVLSSLSQARMTEKHAEILVEGCDTVEPELRAPVVAAAIELAESEPVGTFRRKLRRLIEITRAATLAERHTEALTQRRVYVEDVEDGMAWLHALMPAVEAHAIDNRLTHQAKAILAAEVAAAEGAGGAGRGGEDPGGAGSAFGLGGDADDLDADAVREQRTLQQTRSDILCDLLIDGETDAHDGAARGIRAIVTVTVPALTLLAESDAERHDHGLEPASIEGLGPIPLHRAKELCGGDAGWTRVLTHPETGMILSVGRDQYRPPPSLRKLVRWRAERCMAPGCHMPASRCEIDHTLAWEDGGTTALENLNPICKGHHLVKHHGGWTVTAPPGSGGALHWHSPTGRHYIVHPERRIPTFRPSDEIAPSAPF